MDESIVGYNFLLQFKLQLAGLRHINDLLRVTLTTLKCLCNEKIVDPILNATEQHFRTSLNGVFSAFLSYFVLKILGVVETLKLGVSDVI